MDEMVKKIQEKLSEIEARENVKVLLAVESGSRAWGFASPDSDYDVRFIYVRPMEDYLRLDEPKDVIEWQLDEVLDINGWDLKKALVQFRRGNAPSLSGAIRLWCIKRPLNGIRFMKSRKTISLQRQGLIIITARPGIPLRDICRASR